MLALQLSVGRPINIQSTACCSSTFGCDAWWGSWDQPPELVFLLSISSQFLKHERIFLFLNVVGLLFISTLHMLSKETKGYFRVTSWHDLSHVKSNLWVVRLTLSELLF